MTATLDWGIGEYEVTAAQLLPAAQTVVASAALRNGERVVDIGCGTGNAALMAAAQGAAVIGVDPAPRLLDVARIRADDQRLDVNFRQGDAAALPIEDSDVDVALSVFGVIFAPDPTAAAAEIDRVLAPGGRSTWPSTPSCFATHPRTRTSTRRCVLIRWPSRRDQYSSLGVKPISSRRSCLMCSRPPTRTRPHSASPSRTS